MLGAHGMPPPFTWYISNRKGNFVTQNRQSFIVSTQKLLSKKESSSLHIYWQISQLVFMKNQREIIKIITFNLLTRRRKSKKQRDHVVVEALI